ncbi:ATP-grasp domain-containing protein [Pseudalkalibacillus hwajinpoensis]|uniref:ATP-grasp domain-containing protein n=1 Tax=Guptibacillus hwajinpoensis TaxID=208199 RepID=A0A4V5PY94_9BACL|nr:ATP-grasp domain-containing protein [Pseudalkalibacillus hwajinpoensis]TKD69238.1 ATP-grasp domain-containing protein [Pseudalkalibacillus hwajinpoensis]
MANRNVLCFIESNPIGFEVLKEAYLKGIYIVFVTSDLAYYEDKKQIQKKYIHEIIQIKDTSESDLITSILSSKYKKDQLLNVISLNDLHLPVAARVAEKLGVGLQSALSIEIPSNKYKFNKLLNYLEITTPNFCLTNAHNAFFTANKIGYPLVIKPINGTGSKFVKLIRDKHELSRYLDEMKSQKSFGRSMNRSDEYLIEEYIDGDLFSVEVMIQNGNPIIFGVTKRTLEGDPYFIEKESIFPIKNLNIPKLNNYIERIIEALGMKWGFAHIEFIYKKDIGLYFIEMNPRLPGGVIPKMISKYYNINLNEVAVNIYCGSMNNLNLVESNTLLKSYHFIPKVTGTINQIKIPSNHTIKYNVEEFKLLQNEGAFITDLNSNFCRLGYVIIKSNTLKKIDEKLNNVKNETSFNLIKE